jgi:hypothetical protein
VVGVCVYGVCGLWEKERGRKVGSLGLNGSEM